MVIPGLHYARIRSSQDLLLQAESKKDPPPVMFQTFFNANDTSF